MNLPLAAVALGVGVAAVVAVSMRDLRAGLIGLAAVLVGGSLLAETLPSPALLGVRVLGGLLAVAILRTAVTDDAEAHDTGSPLGWPAEAFLAAAAGLAGIGIALGLTPVAEGGGAPQAASGLATLAPGVLIAAAATVLFAIGVTPAARGRSGARRAIGMLLIVQAAILLRTGYAGAPGDIEQVAIAGLIVGGAAAAALLAREADGAPEVVDEPPLIEPR
jgi:urea transporter